MDKVENKGKIKVTTFDSIIYQICKLYKYPYLDLPNFSILFFSISVN